MVIKFCLLLICLFESLFCEGQDLCFTNYNSQNGLPSSQVYDMFQDKNGDMWFSTDRGLAKSDGVKFKYFDISNGLPSNTVFDFFPQKDGKVWCSTINNSWFYFQDGTEHFQIYKFSDTLQKYSFNLHSSELLIKNNGNVCVSFEDGLGFLEINKYGKLVNEIRSVIETKQVLKNIQITYGQEFFHYNLSSFHEIEGWDDRKKDSIHVSFEKLGYKTAENINRHYVFSSHHSLFIKTEGNAQVEHMLEGSIIATGRFDSKHLWVSFRGKGIRIYNMKMVEKHHYLPTQHVTNFFRDKHGGIWVSTLYNGVYYAKSDKIEKVNSVQNLFVYQIVQGEGNRLAIVSNDGFLYSLTNNQLSKTIAIHLYGVEVYYDRKTKSFENRILGVKIRNGAVNSFKYAIVDVSENPLRNTLIASPHFIAQGNDEGDFVRYFTKQRLNCTEYAKHGFLYGTSTGLFYLDTLKKKEYKLSQADFQFRITDIKLINGYHFIGTAGNGVLRYHEASGKMEKVTTHDGLTSNTVNEIFAESNSCAWVATQNGLNKLIFRNERCIVSTLTQENGLPSDEITDIIKVGNVLWIGTSTGLLKMNAADFKFGRKNLHLNLFWESLNNNGKNIAKNELQGLEHTSRNIKFDFHLAYFGGSKNTQIRYKLIGLDTKWNETDQHSIWFTYLKPGKYSLVVQAKAENGEWRQNQISLDFEINPPFYATWWFIALMVIVIGLLIYWFFKVRILIYNRDLVRELLRLIVRKIRPGTNSFVIWSQGNEIRISSNDVLFFKAEGNYLEIMTLNKKHMFRYKIGEVKDLVPDKLEYMQVHRSYVVRLDKISGKSLETLDVHGHTIPIGKTYKESVKTLEI